MEPKPSVWKLSKCIGAYTTLLLQPSRLPSLTRRIRFPLSLAYTSSPERVLFSVVSVVDHFRIPIRHIQGPCSENGHNQYA